MNKEQALEGFFRSLKLSLKNASIYTGEHPAFMRSVDEVKDRIDTLLNYLSPIRIGFTPDSLQVGGEYFNKERIHEELARIFHLHIIKSLEIQQGITPEELVAFIKKVYLSPQDVLKRGGFNQILEEEKITHIAVEELDYSQLLRGEGEEIKDIWSHLLQEAVKKEDAQKISELADSFEKVAAHFKVEDILDNERLKTNIDKFFTQLKNMDKDKFRKCSKELLKSIIRNRDISREAKLDKIKKFFKESNSEDMASAVLEEILSDDEFNALSFQIFNDLTEKRKHKKIAESFADQFKKVSMVHRSPKLRQRLEELLNDPTSQGFSEVYRQCLFHLLKDMQSEEKISLDINHLQRNYRYFLLSLLVEEEKKKKVVSTLEKVLDELDSLIQEREFEYLTRLVEVLEKRRKELSFEPVLSKVNAKIINFVVDELAREKETSSVIKPFISYLKGGFVSNRAFLIKIFEENKVNTQILKCFFELHPDSLNIFKKNLRMRASDAEFLKTIVKSLRKIDSSPSHEILTDILSYGTERAKVEALKALQQTSTHDENRLFAILEGGSPPLKKEAFEILSRREHTRKKALDRLFSIPSTFGSKNKLLIEHMGIVKGLYVKGAKDYLIALSKKKFFWNRRVKAEAQKILREWNAGEN